VAPEEPGNLGDGWVGFDFAGAFNRPVRVVNDAVMQALGAYAGGRMLFLGLGTGLGSTLIAERLMITLELGCLRHMSGETLAERLGRDGRARLGDELWQQTLFDACEQLRAACSADYIVLGGATRRRWTRCRRTRRGESADALPAGPAVEEWVEHHDTPSDIWRCGDACRGLAIDFDGTIAHVVDTATLRRHPREGCRTLLLLVTGRELSDLFNTFCSRPALRPRRGRERRLTPETGPCGTGARPPVPLLDRLLKEGVLPRSALDRGDGRTARACRCRHPRPRPRVARHFNKWAPDGASVRRPPASCPRWRIRVAADDTLPATPRTIAISDDVRPAGEQRPSRARRSSTW
jgi:hypothetical protein